MPTLDLSLTDHIDPTHWAWTLSEDQGRYLADTRCGWTPLAASTPVSWRRILDLLET